MPKSSSAAKLDLEYLHLLNQIKPYITCIINTHYIGLIKMWLERLGDEQFPDKELRNEYLQRLWKEIEEGVLEHPFTEPPPAGDLPSLSESNHVDKEVQYSPRCTKRRVSAKGEGDAPFFTGTVAAENKTPEAYGDESSWQDMSEHSPPSSEGKENSEKGLNDKIVELQKQLANSMLRNVELQKTVMIIQEERDKYKKDTEEFFQKEVTQLKEKHQDSLKEQHTKLAQTMQGKYNTLAKKYNSLRQWYQSKVADQERLIKTRCRKKLEQIKKKQAEDVAQVELCESVIEELKLEHEKELERKLVEAHKEHEKKFDAQMLVHKNFFKDERIRHHNQLSEQRKKYQKEIKTLRDENKKIQDEHCKILENLGEIAKQLQISKESCVILQEQIDQLTADNESLSNRVNSQNKYIDEQETLYQNREKELRIEHEKKMNEEKSAHQQQVQSMEFEFEMKIKKQKKLYFKGAEEQRVVQQKLMEKLMINFDEHHKALEVQNHENIKTEMLLKDECIRLCTELQKVRADNKQPLAKIDKLEKEIICLRDIIAEMKHVYTNAQDIFMARLKKMRKYHQRRNASYELLLSSQTLTPSRTDKYDELIVNLEAKYKRIMEEQVESINKQREDAAMKIAELEMRLGLNLLNKIEK
ncbi:golgin subfamily A member 4-like isoform X2 [Atheta coriaria]|uniref:golgin subfamily A member 4-like isoform X2 n=1 Tax=Dalotia coriaria TaxID=877792 RepID=UPI0031F3C001